MTRRTFLSNLALGVAAVPVAILGLKKAKPHVISTDEQRINDWINTTGELPYRVVNPEWNHAPIEWWAVKWNWQGHEIFTHTFINTGTRPAKPYISAQENLDCWNYPMRYKYDAGGKLVLVPSHIWPWEKS